MNIANPEYGKQQVELLRGVGLLLVKTQVRDFARRFVGRNTLGQSAYVFNQHHTQSRWKSPHFTQIQLALILVSREKIDQHGFIESTIGVGHKGPSHAVDPGQTRQGFIDQLGQG